MALKMFQDKSLDPQPSLKWDVDPSLLVKYLKEPLDQTEINFWAYYRKDKGYLYLPNGYSFYLDAPYCWVLVMNDYPACIIGFEIERTGIVCIRQIQGRKSRVHTTSPLFKLSWERFLVHSICGWAFYNGFAEVRIQLSKYNKYYVKPEDLKKFGSQASERERQNQRIKMHYDVTARKLKFERKQVYWVMTRKMWLNKIS